MKALITIFTSLVLLVSGQTICQGQSVLWKISGNGMQNPSYVMGTIHLLCQDELKFSENVKESLKNVDQLYLELDYDDPNLMANMQKGILIEGNQTLKTLYSENDYATLDSFMTSSLGMSVESLSGIKPFFIMSMLYPHYMECPTASMEMELTKLASNEGIEIHGLETVMEQFEALNALSLEQQAQQLLESVTQPGSQMEDFNQMRELYKAEDIEQLYAVSAEEFNKYPGFNAIMLDNRNKNWIQIINEQTSPTFYGVGAAHLGGPNGVIELLRKEGYTVEPIEQIYAEKSVPTAPVLSPEIQLLLKTWKIDESQVSEIADDVIQNIIEKNPSASEQIVSQRSVIEEMVSGTKKQYHEDGTYTLVIPYDGTRSGTWAYVAESGTLTETDSEGNATSRTIRELTDTKLVIINEKNEVRTYIPVE